MTAADRKIFFFDLDGTLLNTEKKITDDTYNALSKWHDKGHLLAISSGRPMISIEQVIRELKLEFFSPYAIAFNGCFIKKYGEKEALIKHTLSLDDMKLAAREASALGLYIHYYDDTYILTPHEGRELEFYTRVVKLPYRVVGELPAGIHSESCKMICIDLESTGRQKILAERILKGTEGRLNCIMSNPWYMEIFPSYAGKGAAVDKMLSLLDIKRENSYAAGDEENDISMLESAGCGIAPANATEKVKAAADVVLSLDNDHDAFAQILLREAYA